MIKLINKIIPSKITSKIKSSDIYVRREAKSLAGTSKRLDICAAQIAQLLHLAKINSLAGKKCLEVGSGWALSHSLIFHLLGAKQVIATDIAPLAIPESLNIAVKQSITSIVRDILSPFEEHYVLRERLNKLLSIKKFSFEILEDLGIKYIAPIDFKESRLYQTVDFIYSNSVFEHIPVSDVELVLENLICDLSSGGVMINCIHLEDHNDFNAHPFAFYSIQGQHYSRVLESLRGNRIRKSNWERIFSNLANTENSLIYEWSRHDIPLPNSIDKSVLYKDQEDLRISHIGVCTKKL